MSHDHHHSKKHKHEHHNEEMTYHLQDDHIIIHFKDGHSPEVCGDISISHFHHGHGGQNVNKSNKGVHIAFSSCNGGEKILSSCNDERSEPQNREKAIVSLLDKIYEKYKENAPRHETKIPFRSKKKRLGDKKNRGQLKMNRQKYPSITDENL